MRRQEEGEERERETHCLPTLLARLHDGIDGRGKVTNVHEPGVPFGRHLRGVEVVLFRGELEGQLARAASKGEVARTEA